MESFSPQPDPQPLINENRKQKENPSVNDSDVRRDGKERVEIRSKGRHST